MSNTYKFWSMNGTGVHAKKKSIISPKCRKQHLLRFTCSRNSVNWICYVTSYDATIEKTFWRPSRCVKLFEKFAHSCTLHIKSWRIWNDKLFRLWLGKTKQKIGNISFLTNHNCPFVHSMEQKHSYFRNMIPRSRMNWRFDRLSLFFPSFVKTSVLWSVHASLVYICAIRSSIVG